MRSTLVARARRLPDDSNAPTVSSWRRPASNARNALQFDPYPLDDVAPRWPARDRRITTDRFPKSSAVRPTLRSGQRGEFPFRRSRCPPHPCSPRRPQHQRHRLAIRSAGERAVPNAATHRSRRADGPFAVLDDDGPVTRRGVRLSLGNAQTPAPQSSDSDHQRQGKSAGPPRRRRRSPSAPCPPNTQRAPIDCKKCSPPPASPVAASASS